MSFRVFLVIAVIFAASTVMVAEIIFTEDFEGDVSQWTFGTTGQTNTWECGTAESYNGSKSAYVSWDGGITATYRKDVTSVSWLERQIDLGGYTSANLSFYWKCNGQGGVVPRDYGEVYVNDGPDHLESDVREFVDQNSWVQKTNIDLSAYVGFSVTLKFKWVNNNNAGDDPPFCIDNIEITGEAGHDFAILPFAEDARSMQDTTVVTGSDVTFHIVAENLGTVPESSPIKWICTGGSPTIDNEFTSVLVPGEARHHVFSSNWTAPNSPGTYYVTFYTELPGDDDPSNDETTVMINVVETSPLPLNESFETEFALPDNWSQENANSDTKQWFSSASYPHSSPYSASILGSVVQQMDDWLFSAPLNLEAAKTYRIAFQTAISDDNDNHDLAVHWGTSQSSTGMNGGIIFDQTLNSVAYEENICYLSSTSSGIYYIGWHGYSTPSSSLIFIDNISVKEVQGNDFAVLSYYEDDFTLRDVTVAANEVLPLNVVLRNEGSVTQTGLIKWTCNGGTPLSGSEVTGLLTQDEKENHNFSVNWTAPAVPGIYILTFYTDLATDSDSSNDATQIEITVVAPVSTPYMENFDGVTSPEIPIGWSIENKNRDFKQWETQTFSPHSSPNDILIVENPYLDMDDWFFSPPMNLTVGTTYEVNFWYSTGGLEQILDVNWGTSATSDGMVFGQIFTDTTNEASYLEGTAEVTPGTSGNFYIGWHGKTLNDGSVSSNLYIDDISVTEISSAHDFAVLAFEENPFSMQDFSVVAGNSVSLYMVVQNLGTTTESSPISWSCTGGTPASNTEITDVLYQNDTDTHTFSAMWTAPTTPGIYTMNFFTELIGDANSSNDATSIQIKVLETCSLPFTEDFEGGLVNFDNAQNNDSNWSVNSAFYHSSGNSGWNNYSINEENILEQTCVLDLTGTSQPYLKFWHIAKTEAGSDKCYVDISVDIGETWLPLPDFLYLGSAAGFDTKGYFDEESYPDWGTGSETPQNSWWKEEIFDLSGYTIASDVMLRMRLVSNTSVNKYGWLTDDITVMDLSEPEPATSPTPMDFSTDICICNDELLWINGFGTSTIDLYFGTNQTAVANMESSAKVIENINANSYSIPNVLSSYTTYFFRVISRNAVGQTEGPVWRFTTMFSDAGNFEGFESGDFSSFSWNLTGNADWEITDSTIFAGTYSAKSGAIGNNEISELSISMNVETAGNISFYRKISSEAGADELIFYIDGVMQENWSGEEDWSLVSYAVSAGFRTFKWSYDKNVSSTSDDDSAWIDCITFPALDQTPHVATQNLQLNITGNDVVLTWDETADATLYKVYYSESTNTADFLLLDTTPETSYTHINGIAAEKMFYYVTAQ